MRVMIIVLLSLMLSSCGYVERDVDGNIVPPDFYDGTWSSCTYTNPDGRVVTPPPVRMPGVLMEWTEPDGTSVKCIPMVRGTGI